MSSCNSGCSSCGVSGCSDRSTEQTLSDRLQEFAVPANAHSNIKKVIGIVSGKGGVGKSFVTSMLAVMTRRKGYNTALLDADITGPSIPKSFGVDQKLVGSEETGFLPASTSTGISVISSHMLLEKPTDAVIWRGPIVAGIVKQFWGDTAWGDVDYMFVDMPPGTGDVPLTVFQSLPLAGIVIVTSPQELVSMIVSKAVNMAKTMNVPVLGLVENMSYFECTDCHSIHHIFGESHIDEIAMEYGLDVLAKIPINPEHAKSVDAGLVEYLETPCLNDAVEIILSKA